MRAKIQELTDRQQIQEIIYYRSRGIDRLDADLVASAFWPDARFPARGESRNAEEAIRNLVEAKVRKRLASSHHMIGNIIIELDGDRAYTETYGIAHHRTWPNRESNADVLGAECLAALGSDPDAEHVLITGFRYLDRFERREGVWKIAERRLVFDWSHTAVYLGGERGGLYAETPYRGQRGKEDISYATMQQRAREGRAAP